jgi:hypothetical protein
MLHLFRSDTKILFKCGHAPKRQPQLPFYQSMIIVEVE